MLVFLFTDIEGSTPLWETYREAMLPALLRHNGILQEQITQHGGRILELRGDGVKAVFEDVNPLPCVLAMQKAFGRHEWGKVGELRIRMGLHGISSEQEGYDYFVKGDQYYGPALHQAARIMDAGWGGQILVSEQMRNTFPLPPGATWQDFGQHQLKGVSEAQPIYGLLHPDLPHQQFPPLRTATTQTAPVTGSDAPESFRHNLPPQLMPFIGRVTEVNDLEALMADPTARLVTILGPGGMGKTRLALAVGERQLPEVVTGSVSGKAHFPHGVYFVPLAQLTSADYMVPAIAEALNLHLDTGRSSQSGRQSRSSKEQLLDYVRQKRLLLILDNFEHLLDGAMLVTDILQAAPGVQILVTSRERLHLHDEQLFAISGLPFPEAAATDEGMAKYDAVKLFVQAAQRSQRNFELGHSETRQVARICQLLDGMPLGIELAAAWVDVLSLDDTAAEIQASLDFLATEWQDVPQRHHSIRAVFDVSWRQLSQAEQAVFTQLSVFRGGFTRAAVQGVIVTQGASVTTLRLLATLVDKSFIQYDRAQDRYNLHQLLRQYGVERMAADPTAEAALRDRHSAYYCTALERWSGDLKGARQVEALIEMAAEFENVRVAWEWAAQHGKVDRLDQAVAGLCLYGQLRYRSQEAQHACRLAADKLAQMASSASAPGEYFRALARIQTWQAAMSLLLGQRAEGKSLLQQSLDLLNRPEVIGQDTRRERALALGLLADTASPKWEEARCLREQSVALSRELGDDYEAADRLIGLGIYEKILGQYDSARQHFEESLALFERVGHPTGPVYSLNELGMLARDRGQDEEARHYFERALALSHSRGNLWGIASSRQHLAWLALFHGHFEEAITHLQPAQAIYREVGDHGNAYGALRNIAVAYWLLGRFPQADELLDQVVLFYQQGGDLSVLADVIALQAEVCACAGQYEEARALAHHALGLVHHLWDIREPMAKAQRALGWVALAQAAWGEARRHFQEAITIYRAMGGQYGQEYLVLTLVGLSRAEHGLGNQVKARQHLNEALGIVLGIGAFIPSLFLMPMVSLLLASQGEAEQAVTFYTMASRYPFVAHSCLIQDLVGPNMATAAASLPPDVYQQAIARGQALAWWAAAAELRTAWLELDQGH